MSPCTPIHTQVAMQIERPRHPVEAVPEFPIGTGQGLSGESVEIIPSISCVEVDAWSLHLLEIVSPQVTQWFPTRRVESRGRESQYQLNRTLNRSGDSWPILHTREALRISNFCLHLWFCINGSMHPQYSNRTTSVSVHQGDTFFHCTCWCLVRRWNFSHNVNNHIFTSSLWGRIKMLTI